MRNHTHVHWESLLISESRQSVLVFPMGCIAPPTTEGKAVADGSVGQVFFVNYYLVDTKLMGDDGRKAIAEEDKKYGVPVFLPPAVPFHSNEWHFTIDPTQGEGPATIEEIK